MLARRPPAIELRLFFKNLECWLQGYPLHYHRLTPLDILPKRLCPFRLEHSLRPLLYPSLFTSPLIHHPRHLLHETHVYPLEFWPSSLTSTPRFPIQRVAPPVTQRSRTLLRQSGSSPSLLSNFSNHPQNCLALRMFRRTTGQSLSDRCRTRPKHLKDSTPSKHSAPSSPVRMKVAPMHFAAISTSRLSHLICIFRLHHDVWRCMMIRPAGICILHKPQRVSGAAVPFPPGPPLSETENVGT